MALGDLRTLILLLSCASSCHGLQALQLQGALNASSASSSNYRVVSMFRDLSQFDHLPSVLSSIGVALSHLRASWRYSFNLYAWKRDFTESERKGGHPIFQTIRFARAALGAFPNRDPRKENAAAAFLREEDVRMKMENHFHNLNLKVQSGGNHLFLTITLYAIVVNFANFFWFRAKEAGESADDVLIAMATGTPLVEEDLAVAPALAPIALDSNPGDASKVDKQSGDDGEILTEEEERKQADLKWVTWLQPLPLWFKVSWINLVSGILGSVRFVRAVMTINAGEVHFLGRTMWERFINSLIDYAALPVFLINIYKWEQPFILKDLLGLAVTNSGVFVDAR